MDADRFDALVRGLGSGSRRRVLGMLSAAGLGALAPLIGYVDGEAGKNKKKNKKKRKKRNKKKDENICAKNYPHFCPVDRWCCSRDYPVCCMAPFEPDGIDCFESYYQCCPVEYGGGACTFNEACCPPRKGELEKNCINPALGEHCCPLDSGGYCYPNETCCPPALTNANNYGCCDSAACCNSGSDCNLEAGERCSGGCCYSF